MIEPTENGRYSRRRTARQKRIGAQIGGRFDGLPQDAGEHVSEAVPVGGSTMHVATESGNAALTASFEIPEPEMTDDTPAPDTSDGLFCPDAADTPPNFSPSKRRRRLENTYARWEDTSTLLKIPEHKAFWNKQPPLFWVAAVVLLIGLCTVIAIVGVNRWHEADLARKEARRLRELAAEKAKYKFLYRDIVEKYADQNNIDPALVAAVIYNESRFEPKAESRAGARGLMQIMEETGPWIAEKLGESNAYTFDSLFVPETNIRFGSWYLGYLSSRFGGDIVKVAAGYHAGQNRVSEWLKNKAYSHDGWSLDVIPFQETDQYVKKVVNAYEIYTKHYYAPEEAGPAAAI